MRTLRILFLDHCDNDTVALLVEGLRRQGLAAELVQSSSLSEMSPADYDYVVIGNNTGLGQEQARLLPEVLRPLTIVVSHEALPNRYLRAYQALGYTHFGTRWQAVLEWIEEQVHLHLGLPDPAASARP